MNIIFQTILNYLLFLIKSLVLLGLLAIPFIAIFQVSKMVFAKIIKSKNQFTSLFIISYIWLYLLILIYYFIPLIGDKTPYTIIEWILFILFHILRLAIINLLFTGIVVIFELIAVAIYEKQNRKRKIRHTNLFNLWLAIFISLICFGILLIIFPKLISIILYLLYM
ncbi:MAG: hypothetical protein V1824_00295 [archaeon]